MDGARHCGTLEENSQDPFAEFFVQDVPDDFYLFTITFTLDENPNLASLLFSGFYPGGTGYEVALFDGGHGPLRVVCLPLASQSVAAYADGLRSVQHRCAEPTAEEATLRELAKTRYVRVHLPGAFRQFWVQRVSIKFRKISDLPPSPPPTPALPSAPPRPPAPVAPPDAPHVTCPDPYENLAWSTTQYTLLAEEPCGLSYLQCCAIAREHAADAYLLSKSGCCSAVSLADASVVPSVVVSGSSGLI